jgi:hypothetical protein
LPPSPFSDRESSTLKQRLRYPPNTPEKQKNLGAFFGKNPPPGVAGKLPDFVKALGAKHPEIKSWGVLGVITLPLLASTQPPYTHPSII